MYLSYYLDVQTKTTNWFALIINKTFLCSIHKIYNKQSTRSADPPGKSMTLGYPV